MHRDHTRHKIASKTAQLGQGVATAEVNQLSLRLLMALELPTSALFGKHLPVIREDSVLPVRTTVMCTWTHPGECTVASIRMPASGPAKGANQNLRLQSADPRLVRKRQCQ